MSEVDFNSKELDSKANDKMVTKPEFFSNFKDTDFKLDIAAFRTQQVQSNNELIKNGILSNCQIVDCKGDTTGDADADKRSDVAKNKIENPSDRRQVDRSLRPGNPSEPAERQQTTDVTQPGQSDKAVTYGDGTKKSTLVLDKDGLPIKFEDRNGDKFTKGADGKWYRESLLDAPQQVDLTISKDGTVTIKYPVPGKDPIERSIQKDGTEVTRYPEGVETTRKRDVDGGETLTVKNAKGTQTLQYDRDGKLTSFEAPDGTRYVNVQDKLWQRISKDGSESFTGTVKVDSNGTVTIRNEDRKGTDKYAIRYGNDGVEVTSGSSKNDSRTITTPDGLKISDGPKNFWGFRTRQYDYPKTNDKLTVRLNADGRPTTLEGEVDGQKVSLRFDNLTGKWTGRFGDRRVEDVQIEEGTGAVKIKTTDGKTSVVNDQGKVVDEKSHTGRKIEERSVIDEMPEKYKEELDKRVKELENFKRELEKKYGMSWEDLARIAVMGPAGALMKTADYLSLRMEIYLKLKSLTEDNGKYDDKQKGGQYQKWGNFAFGVYAKALGLTGTEARTGTGFYKWWQGKTEDQNDYDVINRGMRYYESEYRRRRTA